MNSPQLRGIGHHDRSRRRSQGHWDRGRESRNTLRQARSTSEERPSQLLRVPADGSRPTSPSQEHGSSTAIRDYADQNANNASHTRTRSAVFPWAPGSLRRRLGSTHTSVRPSPALSLAQSLRNYYQSRRRSVAVASTSARDTDTASRHFSLAGPASTDTIVANKPYVDPGYSQLNPAYNQPSNVRPVWGLAKPLPRVIRPGMIPASEELDREFQEEQEEQARTGMLSDLESGRIEPSLRPRKVSSQLDSLRRERELSLFRAYRHVNAVDTPSQSPFTAARRPSDTLTEIHDPRGGPGGTIREESEEDQYHEHAVQDTEFPQLREAVTTVQRAHEEEDLKAPYMDMVPLPAYDAEDDEIHNLHTYWSVVRLRFREPLAETLAIMVQFTLGFSSNLVMTVSKKSAGEGDTTDYTWGFAAMVGIYIAGGISGAHLNPAMSFMFCVYRGFPLRKLPVYVCSHFLGAFLASLIAYGVFKPGLLALEQEQQALVALQLQPAIRSLAYSATDSCSTVTPFTPTELVNNFITSCRKDWVTQPTAFFTEFVATTILAIAVLALGDDTNSPPGAGMNAFIIGILVTLLSICFGYITGLAMNPARDFGPRLGMWVLGYGKDVSLWADGYWFKVAWCGPVAGALLGGLFYDGAIFVGGESPVNYPPVRVWRAVSKFKTRLKATFGRTKFNFRKAKNDAMNGGYERID